MQESSKRQQQVTLEEQIIMRIEFKVYTTRRQKAFIHGLKRGLFAILGALLPFGEVAGAILLILSMCCMDSDNFMPVFRGFCWAGLLLVGCLLMKHMFEADRARELQERRRLQLRRRTA